MGPSFDIETIERDHTLILRVVGELDLATAPLLDERLRQVDAADARRIVLDLDQLEFIDVTGLHVLLAHVPLDRNGGRYALTRGSPQVRRLFEVIGVLGRLPFTSD